MRFANKDFLAGLLFLGFGWAGISGAREFEVGTLARMGPGWFPMALGTVLERLRRLPHGARHRLAEKSPGPLDWGWRAPACIVASMLAFGFLMPRLGLVPALVVMFFAAAGGREFRWGEVLVLTVVMTAFAAGVFVRVLKLPFQALPRGVLGLIENLALGFGVAFSLQNLAYCFAGVALGTLIGVLPGITPLVAIGMLFPLTFTLPPVSSLIMLAEHLLRRAVRRLDHRGARQSAGRDRRGGDVHRRLPDGAPGRAGPLRWRRSLPSSRGASARCSSRSSGRRSASGRSSSAPGNTARSC